MSLEKIAPKVLETDVLVMGGGIAGCPFAWKAAEHGLRVTLVEKAKTDRSGSGGAGIDHYGPLPHDGCSVLDLIEGWEEFENRFMGTGRFKDPNPMFRVYDNILWTVEELERMGVTMRWDDGDFYWTPDVAQNAAKVRLRVHWQNVKPQMATAVRKRKVNVLERTMIVDLLTNKGAVVGATAVNTRTGEFMVIKARAVVIATGLFARCYDPETPVPWKYKFRSHWCPATVCGDGMAVAYRAGAGLANMDITGWFYRIRDDLNISFGNFDLNDGVPARWLTWNGEEFPFLTSGVYDELEKKGLTPVYRSLDELSDDWHKRMEVAFVDERMVSFKVAEDRGFNPKTHWYEVMALKPHSFMTSAGIETDDNFKSSEKGLYAIGDCVSGFHDCAAATVSAMLLGDSIHKDISQAKEPVIDEQQVEMQKQIALAPLAVKDGTEPMEFESAIRYTCERYASIYKSEGKLREGLRRLDTYRRVFLPQLMAQNPHYLMRCLEVRNILELAELHLQGCLERKETRGGFIRVDYPEKDPARDDILTYQKLQNGKAILETRKALGLKPEYTRKGKK